MKQISDEEMIVIEKNHGNPLPIDIELDIDRDIAQAQLKADQKDIQDKIDGIKKRLDKVDNYYVGLQEADRTRSMYKHIIMALEELLR